MERTVPIETSAVETDMWGWCQGMAYGRGHAWTWEWCHHHRSQDALLLCSRSSLGVACIPQMLHLWKRYTERSIVCDEANAHSEGTPGAKERDWGTFLMQNWMKTKERTRLPKANILFVIWSNWLTGAKGMKVRGHFHLQSVKKVEKLEENYLLILRIILITHLQRWLFTRDDYLDTG